MGGCLSLKVSNFTYIYNRLYVLIFLRVVSLIAGRVIMYRTSYMSSEVFFGRFIGIVVLFVMSIFLLILRPNLIRLLLG